jgi:hypothetical protein
MNIRTTRCTRCDLGYVIKDHITAIMQILTNELPQFNFRLQTSKCLNTSVMMMMFLAGKRGIDIANYCDTREVIQRHKAGEDQNTLILNDLKKQLFSKREKARTLYYILLTDGYFPIAPDASQSQPFPPADNVYFPGHVFILEKVWDVKESKHYFYFYQSYINQYTLKQHIEYNNGLKITWEKAQNLIDNLESVLNATQWGQQNVKKWKEMTFTNSSKFNNTTSQGNFFLCFKKTKSKVCYDNLSLCLQRVLRQLEGLPTHEDNNVYGDQSLYDEDAMPLTNKQLKDEAVTLLSKINIFKNKS